MASSRQFVCVHCGRHGFVDASALNRHISQNELCRQLAANIAYEPAPDSCSDESHFGPDSPEFVPFEPDCATPAPPPKQSDA